MKIAYFSPMPPAKSGIATYSSHLVHELAARCDVTVFSPGVSDWSAPANCRIVNFSGNPSLLKSLDEYDQVVYHLGNNPWFHLDIYRAFLQWPGLVVLHDLVLYYLIAGLGRGGLIKEFCNNYGYERLEEVWELMNSCPGKDILRYQNPARYPFLRRVLELATGVIVHNQTSAEQVKAIQNSGPVCVVPLLYYPEQTPDRFDINDISKIRQSIGINGDEVLLGIFGFIGRTKRIACVLKAVRRLLDKNPRLPIKILIVGEGDSLKEDIAAACLGDRVIQMGFVADDKFAAYIASVDLVANLRYPSMGESSASLIQAMAFGKPVLVSNHAFFSEFPDNVVAKVSYGKTEIEEIATVVQRLVEDKGERGRLGDAARSYVELHCAPAKVADLYLNIFRSNPNPRESTRQEPITNGAVEPTWAEQYFQQRWSSLAPSRV